MYRNINHLNQNLKLLQNSVIKRVEVLVEEKMIHIICTDGMGTFLDLEQILHLIDDILVSKTVVDGKNKK